MAFPTYTADPAYRIFAVEHGDGVAAVYSFPYTPVSQEEAWIFGDLYKAYGTEQMLTAATLVTDRALTTRSVGALTVL